MKKTLGLLLSAVLCFALVGCGAKSLTYYNNLGYAFDTVKHTEIIFKAYHSNTEDHTWELLETYSVSPEKGHYPDVRIDSEGDVVSIVFEDNYVQKDDVSESYFTTDVKSFDFIVPGLSNILADYSTFDVKNIKEEQFYRLYSVDNKNGTFYTDVSLDKPYDVEGENLDNILITIMIQ